jgi:hypothetical protein
MECGNRPLGTARDPENLDLRRAMTALEKANTVRRIEGCRLNWQRVANDGDIIQKVLRERV